jgi:hypothetical protein
MLLAILLFALTVAAWGYVVYAINKPWGWSDERYTEAETQKRIDEMIEANNRRAVHIITCDPTQLKCTTLGCTHGRSP